MISFRSEWEWGWKTPLLLDPASFSLDSPIPFDLLSPSLLDSFPFAKADLLLAEELAALKSSRVGLRFERIQELLFRFHPRTLELRRGIQIPGRTEIDLLQRIAPDLYVHWEIAAKFYLALDRDGSRDPFRFVGLSLQDSLGRKLRIIREKQLRALLDPAARTLAGIEGSARVLALPKVHGVLFLPFSREDHVGHEPAPSTSPAGVSGLRGYWVAARDAEVFFEKATRDGNMIRPLLERKQWIQDQRLIPEIQKEVLPPEIHPSTQYAILSKDRAKETRFFIVEDDWRERAEEAHSRIR